MSIYSIVLFIHIAGALGFFVVQGVEWIGLSQLRRAVLPEESRAILGVVKRTNILGAASILTTITTGLYMMLTVWHGVPWILVVLGALVLEIVIFVALNQPRMAAIERALDTEERPVSKTFHSLVNHPLLWISVYTRTALLLGIVFLKIAKPDLDGSLLTIGIAIVLGLASALPALRQERGQARPPVRVMIALLVTVIVTALGLLAVKSISASAIPLSTIKPDSQYAQTKRVDVGTEVDSSNASTPAPTPSPEAALQEGASLLSDRCTQCHPLKKILQVKRTRAEWEKTLTKMESFNVKISDTEKDGLLDYLTTVYTP